MGGPEGKTRLKFLYQIVLNLNNIFLKYFFKLVLLNELGLEHEPASSTVCSPYSLMAER